MDKLIRVGKRLIPLEQVALIEPYVADPDKPLNTSKQFHSRLVLLDKDSVLSEETVPALAEAHAFRMVQADGAATNPGVAYWVEQFEPDESFRPEKPFQSRLLWRSANGLAHSRLLLAPPETVLAIAVRGLPDPELATDPVEAQAARRRRAAPRRRTALAKDPA
jgi:hypothetical protein